LALVLALPLAVPAPGWAQGPVVREIEVRGLQALAEETLLYYLGLEEGAELDEAALDRNVQGLWQRELIDDIVIRSEPVEGAGDGAVKLVIEVVERPVLRSVDYRGLKKVSQTDVRDRIVSARIGVREGGPVNKGELNRLAAEIEQLYREKGYRFAEVTWALEPIETTPNEVRVVYDVDEGDRVRIEDIDFEGNTVYSDLRLRLKMRKTKESGLISRVLRKDIFNPATLEEDLDAVRELYRNAGFKNVLLGDPEVEVRALRPDAAESDEQKRRIFLTVPVEEGERWRFGEISIEGNKTYSDQALLRVFRNKPGTWLRANLIDEGVESINELYNNTGYMFARIEPEIVERDDQVADVLIKVDEGDQFTVGRIEFEGNARTRDKVLRRELRVQEGLLMNVGALRSSVYKVNQLGYFKLDEEDPVQVDVDQEDKEVNLNFSGDESDRTELQFGGGWSEFEGFFGQFSIRTQNFLGRGERVQASFQSGRFRTQFDLGYFVPWFLDRPQTVGFRVFRSELDYGGLSDIQDLTQNSEGVQLTYGRNLRLFQSVAVTYTLARFENNQSFSLGPGVPPLVLAQDIDSSSLRPIWAFDKIDNRFEPTRGTRATFSTELSGGFLSGDSEFVEPELTMTLFRPLDEYPTQHVVGLNAHVGYLYPFGQGVQSVFDYFVIGGERSIRGHARRSLFPRDEAGNLLCVPVGTTKPELGDYISCTDSSQNPILIGGDRYVQINLEYHYLAGGPFRFILFADAGQVWAPGFSLDVGSLRYTAGAEMRVLVPVFGAPLRFIYAFNLNEEPFDEFEQFQFTIGSSF
jgi:outer membrane protein insertion porin family